MLPPSSQAEEPVADPADLGRDARDQSGVVARAERGRQHTPGVGLDLEVVGGGRGAADESAEARDEVVAGAGQRGLGVRVQRHVEVHPPGAVARQRPVPVQGLAEVVARQGAAAARLAGLVQEAVLGVAGERRAGGPVGGLLGVQRGRGLHLDDREAGVGEGVQGGGSVLELRREVAGVDADAEVAGGDSVEAGEPARPRRRPSRPRSPARARCPTRTGRPDLELQLGEALGEEVEVLAGRGVAVGVPGGAPAERERRDAAASRVVGQQHRQHPRAVEGVVEPAFARPVRAVDRVLDDRVVEAAVGEGVDRDHLEAVQPEHARSRST